MTTCPACSFENPPGMKFCGGCGQPLRPSASPEAERRQVTVMFCDLVGSSALADRLDPEELRDLIRQYQQAAGEAIDAFDGHVAQHLGDGLLVYFGYPRAHEDDARRAVHAGLGVLAAMDRLNAGLPESRRLAVRIGIHTGPVVAGEVGSGITREKLALGATPNVAARLQEVAGAGSVAVSEQTHRLLGGAFQCETLGVRALKGIAEPPEVFRVSGVIHATPTPRFQTPMVGREAELAALAEAFGRARTGRGEVAVVVAEPGLGKSRLIRAFQEQVSGTPCSWYEAHCSPYEQVSALRPVASLVRSVLQLNEGEVLGDRAVALIGTAGERTDEAVPLLADLLEVPIPDGYAPVDMSPQKRRMRTMEVAGSLVLARTTSEPAVVLVEDLHWADPSTGEFLQMLADRSAERPVLTLLTSRPDDRPAVTAVHTTELRLTPAPPGDVTRIIETVTGGRPLPASVVAQIIEKADGVPLFAEELTKAIVESGALSSSTGDGSTASAAPGIPVSLQASLTARLDRLPSGKGVAQLASVIGREFSLAMLTAVSDLAEGEVVADLDRLVDLGILERDSVAPQPAYAFRHALLQDAAYQMLLKRTRARYHGRIAATLIDRFADVAAARPELVAQHLTEAGEGTRAAGYWLQAGQRAMRLSANLEAVTHFRRGLALVDGLPGSADRDQLELALRTSLGSVLVFTQGYTSEEVETTYVRARELSRRTGDEASNAWITIGIWSFLLVRGDLAEATALIRRQLERARHSVDVAFLSRTQLLLAWSEFFSGAFLEAQRHLDEVLSTLETQDDDFLDYVGVDMRASTHALAGLTQWHLGHLERSRVLSARALELVHAGNHAYSLANVLVFAGAEVSSFRGDTEAVRRHAIELSAVCEEHGFPAWLGQAAIWLAWAHACEEAPAGVPGAEVDPIPIIEATRAAGARLALSYFGTLAAETLLWRGQLGEARTTVDEALQLADSTGDRMWAAETHRVKAELIRRMAGDRPSGEQLREAESHLQIAIDTAKQQGSRSLELRAAIDLARLWRDTGRVADARQLVLSTYQGFSPDDQAPDLIRARAFIAEGGDGGVPHGG